MLHTVKSDIRIERVAESDGFYALKDQWNRLLSESATDSFFMRWEWLYRWWSAYRENDLSLCILTVYRGEDLVGVAPFYKKEFLWKGMVPVRRLLFLGTEENSVISEYMDFFCKPGCKETVISATIEYLTNKDLFDDIFLQKIDTSSVTTDILRRLAANRKFLFRVENEARSPFVGLAADYNSFLGTVSGSMRHKIKGNMKRIKRYPDVSFRRTERASQFKADFGELVRLHRLRWTSKNLRNSFSDERFALFQEEIMQDMLKNGTLELRFLSVSGRNIAVLYNIAYKGKVYFYQSGLDTSFDKRISPGLLLHNHSIMEAAENGVTEYDFMVEGKTDEYKKHWAKNHRYICDLYIARPVVVKVLKEFTEKLKKGYKRMQGSFGSAKH